MRAAAAAAKMGLVSAAFALLVAVGCDDDDPPLPPAVPPTAPTVDITGSWDVTFELGGSWVSGTAILQMDSDGNVTGTATDIFGGGTVTGSVTGYDLSLTIDDGLGYKAFLSGTLYLEGTSGSGTWDDTDGEGGNWVAAKLLGHSGHSGDSYHQFTHSLPDPKNSSPEFATHGPILLADKTHDLHRQGAPAPVGAGLQSGALTRPASTPRTATAGTRGTATSGGHGQA